MPLIGIGGQVKHSAPGLQGSTLFCSVTLPQRDSVATTLHITHFHQSLSLVIIMGIQRAVYPHCHGYCNYLYGLPVL